MQVKKKEIFFFPFYPWDGQYFKAPDCFTIAKRWKQPRSPCRWMKSSVRCTHSVAYHLSSQRKEILSHTSTRTSLEDILLNEISSPRKMDSAWFRSSEGCLPAIVRAMEAERGVVVSQLWGEEGGSCFMGPEFQFCNLKSSGNWLHNHVTLHNTTDMCP